MLRTPLLHAVRWAARPSELLVLGMAMVKPVSMPRAMRRELSRDEL